MEDNTKSYLNLSNKKGRVLDDSSLFSTYAYKFVFVFDKNDFLLSLFAMFLIVAYLYSGIGWLKFLYFFIFIFIFRRYYLAFIVYIVSLITQCKFDIYIFNRKVSLDDSIERFLSYAPRKKSRHIVVFEFDDTSRANSIYFYLKMLFCMSNYKNYKNILLLVFTSVLLLMDTSLVLFFKTLITSYKNLFFSILLVFNLVVMFDFFRFLFKVENISFFNNEFVYDFDFGYLENTISIYINKQENFYENISIKSLQNDDTFMDYAVVGAVSFVLIVTFGTFLVGLL